MTDCFFSYKSDDRERVRLARDALDNLGFDVFWDQEVPPGTDWDNWIKLELEKSRCAIVFWSTGSIHSPNVRQEAIIAHNSGKLIQILLTSLTPAQFPMGLYTTQAVNLINWQGQPDDENWLHLTREIEARAAPRWIRTRMLSLENEIRTEQTKRQVAETREANLQQKFVEEIAAHKAALLETEEARATVAPLNSAVDSLSEGKRVAEASLASLQKKLASLLHSLSALETRINTVAEESTHNRWRSLQRIGMAILLACILFGGQSLFLLSNLNSISADQSRRLVVDKSASDLRSEIARLRTQLAIAEVMAAKVKELQTENIDLAKKLEIARGLVEANWIDAAVALKAARDK